MSPEVGALNLIIFLILLQIYLVSLNFYIFLSSSSFDPFMDRQRVPILRFKEARKINLIPFRGISNGHHGQ